MKTYGTLSLTVSSPAQSFCEPLTLAQVKTALRLPAMRSPADDEEDEMLERYIISAREQAELLRNEDVIEKQYDLKLDYFPCEIELRKPLQSVESIKYKNSDGVTTTLTEGTDYIVDTARGLVMPAYGTSWPSFTPWPSSAVVVTFTAGPSATDIFWSHTGQRVLTGMLKLIESWFDGDLPFQVVPGAQQAVEMPFTVTMLLSAGAQPRAY